MRKSALARGRFFWRAFVGARLFPILQDSLSGKWLERRGTRLPPKFGEAASRPTPPSLQEGQTVYGLPAQARGSPDVTAGWPRVERAQGDFGGSRG